MRSFSGACIRKAHLLRNVVETRKNHFVKKKKENMKHALSETILKHKYPPYAQP